jgi:signal peptidase
VTSGVVEEPPRRKRPSPAIQFLRDAGIALAFVVSILVAMYAYTGLWPPLVVVESESMMHSEENISYIGVIDTGDMVLVKDIDVASDVETYIEGVVTGHRTYGDFGDVVIYNKMGDLMETPIIHRAVLYLEANSGSDSYRCEALRDLPDDKWSLSNPSDSWDRLTSVISIYHYGYRDTTVTVDVAYILGEFDRGSDTPQSGFITRGDHNTWIDQRYRDSFKPVDPDWVVGKARGEIPWFGLLKLWISHTLRSDAPENSVRNLWISMIVIVVVPIVIDVVLTYRVRKRISLRREAARREYERERLESASAQAPVQTDPPPPGDGAPPSEPGVPSTEPPENIT